jgi:hypothetical protein
MNRRPRSDVEWLSSQEVHGCGTHVHVREIRVEYRPSHFLLGAKASRVEGVPTQDPRQLLFLSRLVCRHSRTPSSTAPPPAVRLRPHVEPSVVEIGCRHNPRAAHVLSSSFSPRAHALTSPHLTSTSHTSPCSKSSHTTPIGCDLHTHSIV